MSTYAYLLIGLLEVIAEYIANEKYVYFLKPLLMVTLSYHIVNQLSSLGSEDVTFKSHLFLIAILFAWFGDMFLMGTQDINFMLGLGSFLLMQICYIVSFRLLPFSISSIERLFMLVLSMGLNFLIKDHVKELQIPLIIYSIILSMTSICATECVNYTSNILKKGELSTKQDTAITNLSSQVSLLSYGTKLFVLSDALIALTKFGVFVHNSTFQTVIMVTYILGQLFIANGYIATLKIHAAFKAK